MDGIIVSAAHGACVSLHIPDPVQIGNAFLIGNMPKSFEFTNEPAQEFGDWLRDEVRRLVREEIERMARNWPEC